MGIHYVRSHHGRGNSCTAGDNGRCHDCMLLDLRPEDGMAFEAETLTLTSPENRPASGSTPMIASNGAILQAAGLPSASAMASHSGWLGTHGARRSPST
jgi:hypothetical protein